MTHTSLKLPFSSFIDAKSAPEFVGIISGVQRFFPSSKRIAAHCILIRSAWQPILITFITYLPSLECAKKFKSNSPSKLFKEALISKFSYNFFSQ